MHGTSYSRWGSAVELLTQRRTCLSRKRNAAMDTQGVPGSGGTTDGWRGSDAHRAAPVALDCGSKLPLWARQLAAIAGRSTLATRDWLVIQREQAPLTEAAASCRTPQCAP